MHRPKYLLAVLLVILIAVLAQTARFPVQAQDPDLTQSTSEVVREFNQLGGLAAAVAGAGERLAAGIGRRLVIFDSTSANQLAHVGQSVPLAAEVTSIVVNEQIAYVAAGDGGLNALDITDPRTPKLLWHDSGYARQLHILADTLYVAGGSSGLSIFDLTAAEKPELISRFPTPGEYLRAVDVTDGTAFAVGSSKLILVDVSYPKKPAQVGEYAAPSPQAIKDVAVDEGRALITVDGVGLIVLSVTNPVVPQEIGRYDDLNDAGAIHLYNDLAIVNGEGANDAGLHVLAVKDEKNIHQAGFKNGLNFSDAAQYGDSLAMASGENGINLLSLQSLPQVQATHVADTNSFGRIAAGDTVLAAAVPVDGLQLFDASNPVDPRLKGSLLFSDYVADIAISGQHAYVAVEDGVHVIDISNQDLPREAALIPIRFSFAVMIRDKWAYVASSNEGLTVVDITNPRQPRIVGSLSRAADGAAMGDEYIYLLERQSYSGQTQEILHVISVADPAQPEILSSLSIDIWNLAAAGKVVYGAANGQIKIIDTHNPAVPQEKGTLPGSSPYVYRDLLYVPRYNKVDVYDIGQNPLAPQLVHTFDSFGSISGIVAKDQYLYLTNYSSGLSTRKWTVTDSIQIGWQAATLQSADSKITYHLPQGISGGFTTFYHWRQPLGSLANHPPLLLTNILFANEATDFSGARIAPVAPYQLEVLYDENDLGLVQESSLQLLHFDGASWQIEPSAAVDLERNKLSADPESFGIWALAGTAERQSFLPFASSRDG